MSVLVTGAAGYLGARVLEKLRAAGVTAAGITRETCDLSDRGAVDATLQTARPDVVIHCAAAVPRKAADYADAEAARRSVRMVENLAQSGVHQVVFASSMTVYPDALEVAREDDAAPSGDGYAAGKWRAEQVLLKATGIVATILRLPGLFGPPRRGGVLFNAAAAFAEGKSPGLDADLPRWSAIHVDDAADLLVRAARARPAASRVMNAGYPGPMAIADAVTRLAALFGITFSAPPPKWFTFDLTRLCAELGLPLASFDTRLRQLAEWAREQRAN